MRRPSPPLKLSTTILQMGFFDNLLKDAFSNDPNLSSDKVSGAIDEGSEDDWLDTASSDTEKTDVQKRWLESQQRAAMNSRQSSSSGGGVLANTNVGNVAGRVVGAPLSSELLSDTRWILSFYLTGVPDRDPSNDLFGSRTNVSVRDRRLGLGASLPGEPTGSVIVQLLGDGSVTIEDSWFGDRSDSNGDDDDDDGTTTTERQGICPNETSGQWLLSEDGRTLRVGLPIIGYKRTVTTKGTIQKIYWSSEDEKSTQTSTTYSIPEGMIYGDINVGYGTGGVLAMMEERGEIGGTMLPGGLLRVEKRMGLASSKMVPCGRFHGKIME